MRGVYSSNQFRKNSLSVMYKSVHVEKFGGSVNFNDIFPHQNKLFSFKGAL